MPHEIDADALLNRFLSYVRVETQSDSRSTSTPSTAGQWNLLKQLAAELRALGLSDVTLTEFGYVLATVPATSTKKGVPRVAFLAHADTAEGCSGAVTPLVHRHYDGGRIVLPHAGQVLDPAELPLLKKYAGKTLITSSGDSLLGADDKAGVAIVMSAVAHLVAHPEIPHGPIRVCFNPDEEIGRGVEKLGLDELAADVAYTLDAEHPGEVDYESFSADKAVVTIEGVASHPGWAKDVMVNALRLAADFLNALPRHVAPEKTDGREGFIHPTDVRGGPEFAEITMLLRDFELDGLAEKGRLVQAAAQAVAAAEPRAKVSCTIHKQYRNMRYWLEKDMRPVEYALDAVRACGLSPFSEAIRGGTDGSRLTERGLPCPNLFTGFHQVHSPREWVALEDMVQGTQTVLTLAQLWHDRS